MRNSAIQSGIDLAFVLLKRVEKEAIMEWDEVFALLTIGSTAPYAIEAAANWIRRARGEICHHKNGANAAH